MILHRIGELLLEKLSIIKPLNKGICGVQRIAVGTVAGVSKNAVSSCRVCPVDKACRRIRTGLSVGMQIVCENIACDSGAAIFCNASAVVYRVRYIVNDVDHQIARRCRVTVKIGHNHCKRRRGVVAQGVARQRVAVADVAGTCRCIVVVECGQAIVESLRHRR